MKLEAMFNEITMNGGEAYHEVIDVMSGKINKLKL